MIPSEGIDDDWAGRRLAAEQLRRLAREVVVAEDVDWAAITASLAAVSMPSGRTSSEAWADRSYHTVPSKYTDRGAMMGQCSVVAPPMFPSFESGVSRCVLTLDERFVGAPGMSHGGIVAAIFDQLLGHCVVMHDLGALTTELTVRYHAPVPLHREVVFTAGSLTVEDRLIRLSGSCHRGEKLLAECTGVFVALRPGQVADLVSEF